MNNTEIKVLLDNSRQREEQFRESGAPKIIINKEVRIRRKLYIRKVLNHVRAFFTGGGGSGCRSQDVNSTED